jgi:hypothetical protein
LYELLFVSIFIPFFLYNYLENNDNKKTVMMKNPSRRNRDTHDVTLTFGPGPPFRFSGFE